MVDLCHGWCKALRHETDTKSNIHGSHKMRCYSANIRLAATIVENIVTFVMLRVVRVQAFWSHTNNYKSVNAKFNFKLVKIICAR